MSAKLEKKFDVVAFSKKIEEMVSTENMNYVEALVAYADQNGIEVEAVAAMVRRSEPIKQKLESFARGANLLTRKSATAVLTAFLDENPEENQ